MFNFLVDRWTRVYMYEEIKVNGKIVRKSIRMKRIQSCVVVHYTSRDEKKKAFLSPLVRYILWGWTIKQNCIKYIQSHPLLWIRNKQFLKFNLKNDNHIKGFQNHLKMNSKQGKIVQSLSLILHCHLTLFSQIVRTRVVFRSRFATIWGRRVKYLKIPGIIGVLIWGQMN